MLVAPDNVDTGGYKIGQRSSCIADGWPYAQKQEFRLLTPHDVPSYTNPLPANTNSVAIDFDPRWIIGLSATIIAGWALFLI